MFWSSDKVESRHKKHKNELVTPFNVDAIAQGAYELALGPQAAVSCDGANHVINLKEREAICIPCGQFGLLLTEEIVSIPADTVAFISLKTKTKSQGLVNVSGFHVDPGFKGRLKFWVYNAGNQDITILRGDRTFLIWFTDLEQPTRDPYPNKNPEAQKEITADDLRNLQGRLASPAALKQQISEFEHKLQKLESLTTTLMVVVIGLALALAAPLFENVFALLHKLCPPPASAASSPSIPTPPAPQLPTASPNHSGPVPKPTP